MPSSVQIRVATPADAQSLLAIYAPYVEGTAITFEVATPTVEDFAARIERTLPTYPWLVACIDGEPVGYTYAGRFRPRKAYDWAVETSAYVKRDLTGHGIGRALYTALERILVAQGVTNLCASIAWTDKPDEYLGPGSIRFHEHLGFSLVGTFHGCANNFGTWYDMLWMEKQVAPRGVPEPFVPFCDLDPDTVQKCLCA